MKKPPYPDMGIPYGFEDTDYPFFVKHNIPWPPNVVTADSLSSEERIIYDALNRDLEINRQALRNQGTDLSVPPWKR